MTICNRTINFNYGISYKQFTKKKCSNSNNEIFENIKIVIIIYLKFWRKP